MMKKEWNKIEYKEERSFGDRLNAAFSFIAENYKVLLRFSAMLLLPPAMLSSLFLSQTMGQMLRILNVGYMTPAAIGTLFGFALFSLLLFILVPSLFYALFQLYNERETRLVDVCLADVAQKMKINFLRVVWLTILGSVVTFLLSYCCIILKWSYLPCLLFVLGFSLILGVPLLLLIPIYLTEKIPLYKAIRQAFYLGYKSWSNSLGMGIVLGFINTLIAGIFAFPFAIFVMVESMYFASSNTAAMPIGYVILLFLLTLLLEIGRIVAALPVFLGMAYQYAHTLSHKKNILVVDDIDKAEQSFKVLRED